MASEPPFGLVVVGGESPTPHDGAAVNALPLSWRFEMMAGRVAEHLEALRVEFLMVVDLRLSPLSPNTTRRAVSTKILAASPAWDLWLRRTGVGPQQISTRHRHRRRQRASTVASSTALCPLDGLKGHKAS